MAETIPDDIGQRLHDRATRGEALTAEEQAWYDHDDQIEMAQLAAAPLPHHLVELRAILEDALARLTEGHRITAIAPENGKLGVRAPRSVAGDTPSEDS